MCPLVPSLVTKLIEQIPCSEWQTPELRCLYTLNMWDHIAYRYKSAPGQAVHGQDACRCILATASTHEASIGLKYATQQVRALGYGENVPIKAE